MISHDRARRLISDRLDAPLAQGDARALHEHLAACPDCRRFADQAALLMQDLRAMPRLPASPRVTRAVLDGIEAGPTPWEWLRRGFAAAASPGVAVASSLALVAALAGTIYLAVNPDDGQEPSATISAIAIAPQETATPTAVPTIVAAPTTAPEPSVTPAATVAPTPPPAPTSAPTEAPVEAAAEPTEAPELAMTSGPPVETPPAEAPPVVSDAPAPTTTPESAVRRGQGDERPVAAADTGVISSAQDAGDRAAQRARAAREGRGEAGTGSGRDQAPAPIPDVAQIAQMVTPESVQPGEIVTPDAPPLEAVPPTEPAVVPEPPVSEETPAPESPPIVPATDDLAAMDAAPPPAEAATEIPVAPPIVPVETPEVDLAAAAVTAAPEAPPTEAPPTGVVAPVATEPAEPVVVAPPEGQEGVPIDQPIDAAAVDPALAEAPAPDAAPADQPGANAVDNGAASGPTTLADANAPAGAGAAGAPTAAATAPHTDVPVGGAGQGFVQRRYDDGRIELRAMTPDGQGHVVWSGTDGGLFGSGVTSAIMTPGGDRVAFLTGGVLYVGPASDPNAATAVPIGNVVGYDWSPGGERLAVSDGYGISVFGPNGADLLISVGEPGGLPIGPIDWLPEGISVTSWDGSETVLVPV